MNSFEPGQFPPQQFPPRSNPNFIKGGGEGRCLTGKYHEWELSSVGIICWELPREKLSWGNCLGGKCPGEGKAVPSRFPPVWYNATAL